MLTLKLTRNVILVKLVFALTACTNQVDGIRSTTNSSLEETLKGLPPYLQACEFFVTRLCEALEVEEDSPTELKEVHAVAQQLSDLWNRPIDIRYAHNSDRRYAGFAPSGDPSLPTPCARGANRFTNNSVLVCDHDAYLRAQYDQAFRNHSRQLNRENRVPIDDILSATIAPIFDDVNYLNGAFLERVAHYVSDAFSEANFEYAVKTPETYSIEISLKQDGNYEVFEDYLTIEKDVSFVANGLKQIDGKALSIAEQKKIIVREWSKAIANAIRLDMQNGFSAEQQDPCTSDDKKISFYAALRQQMCEAFPNDPRGQLAARVQYVMAE